MGNDNVSLLNAHKCVAGNDVKAENVRRRYGYCDVTITGGYVGVNIKCFVKDFVSFYNDEVACPGIVAVKS